MSVQQITWAYQQKKISTGATFLLVTLANYSDHRGVSWPGQARLAEDMNTTTKSVIRWAKELKAAGLIDIETRPGEGEGRKTNVYKLAAEQSDSVSHWGGQSDTVSGQSDTVSPKPKEEPLDKNLVPTVLGENTVSTPKANGCPYEKIRALYHEKLPMLPRIVRLTDHRKACMRARWNGELPDLETWGVYFGVVARSKFLTGKTDPGRGRNKPFVADIDFLIRATTVTKVEEGRYRD